MSADALSVIPFDLGRMMFGDTSILFLLEIIVRTVIIYLYTILLVRWVGSRSMAELSVVEFLLVVALGSAVGDPLFQPDVPLFHALMAVTSVILINKLLAWLTIRFSVVQRYLDGAPVELIRGGCLSIKNAEERGIARAEIFEQLRLKGIRNLGEVESAYIEPNGQFSLFRETKPRPGLSIVPPSDLVSREVYPVAHAGTCCVACGKLASEDGPVCESCGSTGWVDAEGPVGMAN